jgi:hypothetical protein
MSFVLWDLKQLFWQSFSGFLLYSAPLCCRWGGGLLLKMGFSGEPAWGRRGAILSTHRLWSFYNLLFPTADWVMAGLVGEQSDRSSLNPWVIFLGKTHLYLFPLFVPPVAQSGDKGGQWNTSCLSWHRSTTLVCIQATGCAGTAAWPWQDHSILHSHHGLDWDLMTSDSKMMTQRGKDDSPGQGGEQEAGQRPACSSERLTTGQC